MSHSAAVRDVFIYPPSGLQPVPGGGAAVEQTEALQEIEHFLRLHGPAPFQILVGEELHGTRRGLFHGHTIATFTQWTGGSESNRQSHFSPPSRPIQTCPVVVPK